MVTVCDVVVEPAPVYLCAEPIAASLNACLIYVDKVNLAGMPPQEFGLAAVTASDVERGAEVGPLNDRPDNGVPLLLHVGFGIPEIVAGASDAGAIAESR